MKRGGPIARRTPLRSSTLLKSHSSLPVRKPLERSGPIKAKSAKRAREERIYGKLRKAFLAEHERCQFVAGCTQPATEIHHRKGRVGALYLDTTHWHATCAIHHAWISTHPREAVAMGVSELRVTA